MIPLKDLNPRISFPIVTLLLIGINIFVFVFVMLPAQNINQFIQSYALIPSGVKKIVNTGFAGATSHDFFRFISSIFMHGSWMHLIGNCWFLWIFGDNVEGVMGKVKYLFFYLLFGITASMVHVYVTTGAGVNIPTIGASGAIAGIMGAYLVLFPGAKIFTFVPFLFIWVLPVPAVVFLLLWFAFQLINGLSVFGGSAGASNVAFWAHIGGFAAGVFIGGFFKEKMRILYRRYN